MTAAFLPPERTPVEAIQVEARIAANLMRTTAAWLSRNHPSEDTNTQASELLSSAKRLLDAAEGVGQDCDGERPT